MRFLRLLPLLAALVVPSLSMRLCAQDNYEIQVYGADTVAPRTTMVELHSNFTVKGSTSAHGSRFTDDGLYPTNHAEHETIEITQGINDWAELGFYIFSSASTATGWQWVGDHIRPRVRAPDRWHWPVGASISVEAGYTQSRFAGDNWTLELRPIIDKQIHHTYIAFNPALEYAINGPDHPQGFIFGAVLDNYLR